MKNYLFAILMITAFGCDKAPKSLNGITSLKETGLKPMSIATVTNPQVRAITQTTFTGVSTVTVTKPSGTIAYDLLIMVIAKDGAQLSKPNTEEGWVRIVSSSYGSGTPLIRAWWKKVSSTDPASYTFATGSSANSGRVDLICVKDWGGSAPTALVSTATNATTYGTPAIPAISPSGGDLMLTTAAVAAASGLGSVTWASAVGFTTETNLSTAKVTMSTASKGALATITPSNAAGNTFTATGIGSSKTAAVLSFIVPAESNRPIIRVYRGGAARTEEAGVYYYLSNENLTTILSKPSKWYDVRSIGENEVDKITATNLSDCDLYIQPGGPTIATGWPYLSAYKTIVRDYVDNGGKYLGVCFGAYMLRNAISGSSYDILPSGNYAYTYSSAPGSVYTGSGADLVNLNLKTPWGSGTRWLTIVGGCYFYCPGTVPDLANLATFIQPNATEPRAAIRFTFNPSADSSKGWIIGIGPHPEATGWGGLTDPDGSDADLIELSVTDLLSR